MCKKKQLIKIAVEQTTHQILQNKYIVAVFLPITIRIEQHIYIGTVSKGISLLQLFVTSATFFFKEEHVCLSLAGAGVSLAFSDEIRDMYRK
jgi:hypothetical protein